MIPDLQPLERHFYTSSACGVGGKPSLEALHLRNCPVIPPSPVVTPDIVCSLPHQLQAAQGTFKITAGLHGAAIFYN